MRFKTYSSGIRQRVMLLMRGPQAADETALLLHFLLATLAAWMAAGFLITIPFAPSSFSRYFNVLIGETCYVTALVLLRRGQFQRASLAYLTGSWIFATLLCFSSGFKSGGGALLYVSLPASAAWLLGYGAAIRTASACLLSAFVFAVLEMTHVIVPFQRTTPLGMWFVIVQAVLINAIPLGQIIGRLRESQQDLAASRDEIRTLAASLLTVQEEERRNLSRELHDQVCQNLVGLAMQVATLAQRPLPPKEARARLNTIQASLFKAAEEARDLAYQVHPPILDELGLMIALEDLYRTFTEQHPDIPVDLKNVGLPTAVPREVASCIFRVAQESLQNISKHANAKNVSVALGLENGAAVLAIGDDGVGFDLRAVKGRKGLGLIGMDERARLVKGKLTITAQPAYGTHITLEIPLQLGNS